MSSFSAPNTRKSIFFNEFNNETAPDAKNSALDVAKAKGSSKTISAPQLIAAAARVCFGAMAMSPRCVSGSDSVEGEMERRELAELLNSFLGTLTDLERRVFLCRYWYMDSIQTIAKKFGFSQSKVTSMLHRTRGKLRTMLEKEGY